MVKRRDDSGMDDDRDVDHGVDEDTRLENYRQLLLRRLKFWCVQACAESVTTHQEHQLFLGRRILLRSSELPDDSKLDELLARMPLP